MCHIAPKLQYRRQDRQHTYGGWLDEPLSDQTRESNPGKVPTIVWAVSMLVIDRLTSPALANTSTFAVMPGERYVQDCQQ
jgi:hypothetical protein